MGKIKISRVESTDNDLSELTVQSMLKALSVSKHSGTYYISVGSTEMEISADLMKDLVEDAFMMLDYEDQMDLMKTFETYLR